MWVRIGDEVKGARMTLILLVGVLIATVAVAGSFAFPDVQYSLSYSSRVHEMAAHNTQGSTHWMLNVYGVTVDVSLSAPRSVVTMVENSFIASAQIVSTVSDPPYNVSAIYIYKLSVFIPRPVGGGWSEGIAGSSENMTVGDTIRISHQTRISAGSCYLAPGQSRILECYVTVEMGVKTEGGTNNHHQDVFQYPFNVIAGTDASDKGWLVSAFNLSSLSLIFVFVILFVAYSFSVSKKNNR